MSLSLLDSTKLISHTQTFAPAATGLGFASAGDINRFLFQSYGKTIKEIPPANRPKGAIFFLAPAGKTNGLAPPKKLKPVLLQIQRDVAYRFYEVPIDLTEGAKEVHQTTSEEQRLMASDAWPISHAQLLSRVTSRCVVWGNGVSAYVFICGDVYLETPDVVEAFPTGLPSTFQSLSWDNGAILYEFAEIELNDTSESGIWKLPDLYLLKPRPEKIMSRNLGKFLKDRMAGYRHHEEEAHVENEGRADISLTLYNGFIYIIEVKWVGQSLVATKKLESEKTIRSALKSNKKGWLTKFDDSTFIAGVKQLAKYFKTGKYQRAYLAVFDCCEPKTGRKHESPPISAAEIAPYDHSCFLAHRACVDPRKASKSSKSKTP